MPSSLSLTKLANEISHLPTAVEAAEWVVSSLEHEESWPLVVDNLDDLKVCLWLKIQIQIVTELSEFEFITSILSDHTNGSWTL